MSRFWTGEEDDKLRRFVESQPKPGNWKAAAAIIGKNENSCRNRWFNQLSPALVSAKLSDQEQISIQQQLSRSENGRWMWSKMAKKLPGRTANQIKNFWNTKINKEKKNFKGSPSTVLVPCLELSVNSDQTSPMFPVEPPTCVLESTMDSAFVGGDPYEYSPEPNGDVLGDLNAAPPAPWECVAFSAPNNFVDEVNDFLFYGR